MDKPSVYIETSIVSYLAADPSRHPVTLRNQQLTHAWWNNHRERYALYTSQFVVDEAADGDPVMAQRRRALLSGIELLEVDPEVTAVAAAILKEVGLPQSASTDAMHMAVTAVREMAYLLTWNCTHIANPALRGRLERTCRRWGYELPILCTPADMRG
jgi:hypothetical protein